jgi:hypothetical protein
VASIPRDSDIKRNLVHSWCNWSHC